MFRNTALLVIMLVMMLTSGSIAAEIEFDPTLIHIDPYRNLVAYPGADTIAAGAVWRLPAITYHIPVGPHDSPSGIEWHSSDSLVLQNLNAPVSLDDIPTASEAADVHHLVGMAARSTLGDRPVVVTRLNRNGTSTEAEILVLPVTVDSKNQLILHRKLTITLNGSPVAPLVGRPRGAALPPSHVAGSAGSNTLEYAIITGDDLAEPMQRLGRYRTGTGIKTDVVLIDSILSVYDGCDEAEQLREYLKDFYAAGGKYVLLAGDETVLPLRYTYHFNTSLQPEASELQICDLYFADLTGDWEVDGDGVWGEPTADSPDYTPELRVGRLPFNTASAASAWIDKLIGYETNPGNGDYDYLTRSYFFTSDQMRDYAGIGQHARLAACFPDRFEIDTLSGVEQPSGDDPAPVNPDAADLLDTLVSGYGIINIQAHGSNANFDVKSSGYTGFPKSAFRTGATAPHDALIQDIYRDGQPSFWYSMACSNASFDKDQPPFNEPYPNLAQTLLELPEAGAVAVIGNTRWGWVGSSHLMQKAFYDSLFANPDRPAIDAMYASKDRYYYYRDIVCGQGFFGDPAMKLWIEKPESMTVTTDCLAVSTIVTVTDDDGPLDGVTVLLSDQSGILAQGITGEQGSTVFDIAFDPETEYAVAAMKDGYTISWSLYNELIASDVDEEDDETLPARFTLAQNYPNPFNPQTTIEFELPAGQWVSLTVYNVAGQQVRRLAQGNMSAGRYSLSWSGRDDSGSDVASGVYFYQLLTEQGSQTRKMVMIR